MDPTVQFGDLRWPGWERQRARPWEDLLTRLLHRVRLPLTVRRQFDHRRDMLTLEQAGNLQLLLQGVIDLGVQGAVVELGVHVGCTTSVLAQVLKGSGREQDLHVYDLFEGHWSPEQSVHERYHANMAALGLPLPQEHVGDIRATLPAQLPARIAFAHVDLGTGGDHDLHRALMLHALGCIHPRLEPQGVIVLMDHHVPGVTVDGHDSNPGVREACDAFFADKPEHVRMLYGGACSHGYVRKHP